MKRKPNPHIKQYKRLRRAKIAIKTAEKRFLKIFDDLTGYINLMSNIAYKSGYNFFVFGNAVEEVRRWFDESIN